MKGGRLAIFGPLPPPMTGMEAFTETLLAELHSSGNGRVGQWIHVDMSISRSISERGKLRSHKVRQLVPQVLRSIVLAARGFVPYYPISQNRIGLVRDAVLLVPFRLARRPIVIHLHGGLLDQVIARQPRLVGHFLRWLLSGEGSRGIVLTPSLRHCLEPLLPAETISVVRNTTVVPGWAHDKRPGTRLRVLYIGTLIESKGYRELAAAVAELVRDGVSVELEVAGEPYEPDDVAWVSDTSAPGVRFLGLINGNDKWRALQRADVLALPTYQAEGQPLALIEGMAAACAIVTTRCEGILDTVGEDEALLLEPRGGADLQADLERAVRGLALDRLRVTRLGKAARERFVRELAPDRFLDAWLAAVRAD